jgi:hypothetical protein
MNIQIESTDTIGELIHRKIQMYSDKGEPHIGYDMWESMFPDLLKLAIQEVVDSSIDIDELLIVMEIEIRTRLYDMKSIKAFMEKKTEELKNRTT